MALNGCTNGLVVTAVVALLLLPVQYYVPDLYSRGEQAAPAPASAPAPAPADAPLAAFAWRNLTVLTAPPLDLLVTIILGFIGVFTYLCEWVQRKLMERRIVKLNQYLGKNLERLRAWDEQQEQQEATLKMVQNATSEYNLLLYLLLRQHRCLAAHAESPGACYYDKNFDDDLTFLKTLQIDA